MVSLLFGFNGRINRVQYWVGCVCAGVGGAILFFMLGLLTMPAGGLPDTPEGLREGLPALSFTIGVPLLLMSWITLALQTKRFHDRGRSGLWTLLPILPVTMIMIPLFHAVSSGESLGRAFASVGVWMLILQGVNLFMLVDLGSMPGKQGANRYGNPPGPGLSGPAGGGAPQRPSAKSQPIPGTVNGLTGAESAIDRAIAAQAKQAVVGMQQRTAPAASVGGLRPAPAGSFGRKAAQ